MRLLRLGVRTDALYAFAARKLAVALAALLAIAVVSVVLPFELTDALSDPIGDASDDGWPPIMPDDPIVLGTTSNGHGEVATLRTQEGLLFLSIPYFVFVHKAGEAEGRGNLAFRYFASTENEAAPTITWTGPSSLRISVGARGVDLVTKQRARIDGVDITYALPRPERPPELEFWQRLRRVNQIW